MYMRNLQSLPGPEAPAEDFECVTLEVSAQACRQAQTHLCPETYIRLFFNGRLIAAQTIYPKDLDAFATGLLLAEGFVRTPAEIRELTIRGDTIEARSVEGPAPAERKSITGMVDLDVIYRGYLALEDCARVCRITGGTHCALLLTEYGGIVSSAEDINRLASLDKAIGKAMLAGHDVGDCILFSTGRITGDTIRHVVAAGVSVVAACGAPSSRAVRCAMDHGLCLIAIPGPHQLIVYSGQDRIVGKEWRHPLDNEGLYARTDKYCQ